MSLASTIPTQTFPHTFLHHTPPRSEAQRTCLLLWATIWTMACLMAPATKAASTTVDHPNQANSVVSAPLQVPASTREGFTRLNAEQTGILFKNQLAGDAFLTDAVAHNGSGVALGDVDGDHWVDIYFCGLQSPNKLYKNLGNWTFKEMSIGPAACPEQRSTGAALIDIDGDQDLDLLVNGIAAGTRLFLNDGTGNFSESNNSGLSRSSSSTSMALADIDMDGDLDLYCAHYVDVMYTADPTTHYALARQNGQYVVSHVNGRPTTHPSLLNRFVVSPTGRLQELPEYDALYLNMGHAQFKAIQFEKGTFNNHEGRPVMPPRDWSLAVMFRDLNGDHIPDLFVCTDNASPDRVWINNGNGTFNAQRSTAIRHTSRSSMGIDFADINRDGLDDFFVADMFARTHEKRMTQLAKQYSDPQEILHPEGRPRYNRNTLFLRRSDHSFVETALMAGVAASDWSWCPVFLDVDLDGFEDLLVTNGFSFDVMDQDSQDQLRSMQISKHERQRSRQFHPPFVTPNAAFRNQGDGTFESADHDWGFDISGISNGMALADLDNDGDQDAVISQLNDQAILLKNISAKPRIKISLSGPGPNTMGIGARVQWIQKDSPQSQVILGGGRYLSSDAAHRVFAVPETSTEADMLEVRWPDNTVTTVQHIQPNHHYTILHTGETKSIDRTSTPSTHSIDPLFSHVSHLIPHRMGTEHAMVSEETYSRTPLAPGDTGPGLAWYDIDEDGWQDLWISAERGQRPGLYLNREGKSFHEPLAMAPVADTQGTAVGWRDDKGGRFWLVATSHQTSHPQRESAVQIYTHTSPTPVSSLAIGKAGIGDLEVVDIDGDGDLDLFVATTSAWGRYPESADDQVWINEAGTLKRSASWSQAFASSGITRGATFFKLDADDAPDLALATEWGPIRFYSNTGEGFVEVTDSLQLPSSNGWWTDIQAGDFNGDGLTDLVATNRGLNTETALMPHAPFRIWYADLNGNDLVKSVISWKSDENWLPFSHRIELAQWLPDLPQRIPSHHQFAKSTIAEILGADFSIYKWQEASVLESSVFLRSVSGFDRKPLPKEIQYAPSYSAGVLDGNQDGHLDLFIGQNAFNPHSEITRQDAGIGWLCLGDGTGSFRVLTTEGSGIHLTGEQRHARITDFDRDARSDISVMENRQVIRLLKRK